MKTSETNTHSRGVGRAGAALGLGAALAVAMAAPAHADTSEAAATAVQVQLANAALVTSGEFSASNDGSTETTSGSTTPLVTVLGLQTTITSGVLAQHAVARNDGSSAACGGLVGPNGALQIGADNSCTTSGNVANGVAVTLGAVNLVADAIYARCTANSDGTVTASSTLVNARASGTLVPPFNLAANPAANTDVAVGLLANLTLNKQVTGTGTVIVTALDLQLVGGLASVQIGQVTCGPNAVTGAVPLVPMAGALPAAGTAIVAVGALGLASRRRRNQVSRVLAS